MIDRKNITKEFLDDMIEHNLEEIIYSGYCSGNEYRRDIIIKYNEKFYFITQITKSEGIYYESDSDGYYKMREVYPYYELKRKWQKFTEKSANKILDEFLYAWIDESNGYVRLLPESFKVFDNLGFDYKIISRYSREEIDTISVKEVEFSPSNLDDVINGVLNTVKGFNLNCTPIHTNRDYTLYVYYIYGTINNEYITKHITLYDN
jgi:hypothetical protein